MPTRAGGDMAGGGGGACSAACRDRALRRSGTGWRCSDGALALPQMILLSVNLLTTHLPKSFCRLVRLLIRLALRSQSEVDQCSLVMCM
eukprot:1670861-Pyramimonas_sp.AAC.1